MKSTTLICLLGLVGAVIDVVGFMFYTTNFALCVLLLIISIVPYKAAEIIANVEVDKNE